MPEGDTVWRTARGLNRALAGAVLTRCDLRFPSVATVDLSGALTLEVLPRGKHLLHRLEGGHTIHSHLRMDGSWRLLRSGGATAAATSGHRVRAVVGTEQWTAVGVLLGMLDVVPTAREGDVVGHLGPDVLGPDWDEQEALARLRRRPQVPVGQALLDQSNLAGIGTMYASEALFCQRMYPWAPVGDLGEEELAVLVRRARRLLQVGCTQQVPSTTGRHERGERTYVHARSGRPCLRCGGLVRVAMIGVAPQERTMFSCPSCQGGLGPTDDGRPQAPLSAYRRRR